MSVLNVNMPERDLDPEELDLEQEEEDAFGTFRRPRFNSSVRPDG